GPRLALAGQVQPHARVDTRRHVHRNLPLRAHASLTGTRRAGVRDDRAVAAARAAGARGEHVAEQRAHRALDLPAPPADVATRDRGARRAAGALARGTPHRGVDLELVLGAEDDLVEVDLDAQERVLAPFRARARPGRAGLRAEEAVEDVAEAEAAGTETARVAHVVALTLLGVAQHVVGVRHELEALRGLLG